MTVYAQPLAKRRALPILPLAIAFLAVAMLIVRPERLWLNALHLGWYLVGIGLAGPLFIAIHELAGARWHRGVVPAANAIARLIPFGSAIILAAILFGDVLPHVAGPGFRAAWLARPLVIARACGYVAAWLLLQRTRALFVVVFSVTICMASVDWMMSLDGRWTSTIFGVYQFAGLFTAGIALMIVLAIDSDRATLHDLGKLLFAFSTFWMYIWFSQYMLIWYGNMPEETGYFAERLRGNWGVLFVVNVILNWAIPFLVLLPQWTKTNRVVLFRIAIVVLVGHWLDLYLSIFPSWRSPSQPSLAPVEILTAVLAGMAMMAIRGNYVHRAVPHQGGGTDPFHHALATRARAAGGRV